MGNTTPFDGSNVNHAKPFVLSEVFPRSRVCMHCTPQFTRDDEFLRMCSLSNPISKQKSLLLSMTFAKTVDLEASVSHHLPCGAEVPVKYQHFGRPPAFVLPYQSVVISKQHCAKGNLWKVMIIWVHRQHHHHHRQHATHLAWFPPLLRFSPNCVHIMQKSKFESQCRVQSAVCLLVTTSPLGPV